MDTDSLIKTSVGSTASGIFSIIMLFFLISFPVQRIHYQIDPIIKSPRPYKQSVTKINSEKILSNFKPSIKERNFYSIILEAANKHGVDPALIKAIIMAESGYDPMAVSKRGAIGLMQLMPSTAGDLGVEDLFDPARNVNAGVMYFKGLLNQFEGNIKLALAAYNAGSKKVREFQGIPPYKATQYYVKKVFEYYYYYQSSMI